MNTGRWQQDNPKLIYICLCSTLDSSKVESGIIFIAGGDFKIILSTLDFLQKKEPRPTYIKWLKWNSWAISTIPCCLFIIKKASNTYVDKALSVYNWTESLLKNNYRLYMSFILPTENLAPLLIIINWKESTMGAPTMGDSSCHYCHGVGVGKRRTPFSW